MGYGLIGRSGVSIEKAMGFVEDEKKESVRERVNRELKEGKKNPDAKLRAAEKKYQQDFFRDM